MDAEQQREAVARGVVPAPKPFNFNITAPLYYNSNAQEVQSGGSAALEGDPELELGWTRGLTSLPVKLSVRLRADADRYAGVPQGNEEETSATVKLQHYDAKDDQAPAPFVSYKGTLLFAATFSPWTQTKNDFAIGLAKLFTFDGDLHALPASGRSSADAVWSLTLSASVQRRLRTPGADSIALVGLAAVSYAPIDTLDVSLGVDIKQRWFDSTVIRSATTARRDFSLEPLLTIVWDPSAILAGSPLIGLEIDFERQSSSLPNKSYSQWAVGPLLTAGWKF